MSAFLERVQDSIPSGYFSPPAQRDSELGVVYYCEKKIEAMISVDPFSRSLRIVVQQGDSDRREENFRFVVSRGDSVEALREFRASTDGLRQGNRNLEYSKDQMAKFFLGLLIGRPDYGELVVTRSFHLEDEEYIRTVREA